LELHRKLPWQTLSATSSATVEHFLPLALTKAFRGATETGYKRLDDLPASCFTPHMVAAGFRSFAPGRFPPFEPGPPGSRAAAGGPHCASLHQRLPQRGQQPRHARRSAIPGPRAPVHAHEKPTRREWRPKQQHLQLFISSIIFNRNSQVCLHNPLEAEQLANVNRARPRARSLSQLHCSAIGP
jgi:hypothetical protein